MDREDIEAEMFGGVRVPDFLPVKGHVLRLPDGVIVVPVSYIKQGSWRCVIVGSNEASLGAGKYDIIVPGEDLELAERILIE